MYALTKCDKVLLLGADMAQWPADACSEHRQSMCPRNSADSTACQHS